MSSPYLKFAYHTFGCKVNFSDSCMISRQLIERGLSQVSINEEVDIYILNTCSVTENADKKAQKFIKKLNIKFSIMSLILILWPISTTGSILTNKNSILLWFIFGIVYSLISIEKKFHSQ